jgi:hypothetical protein
VLEVPLPTPLDPGSSIELTIVFTAQLPEVLSRTGHHGPFAMVGQWFPKVGVRVGAPGFETWHCEPLHVSTEFFADFGTYDVTLTVPNTHVVAATGVLTAAEDKDDGTRVLHYHAEDVHDFAWMIDPYMEVVTGEATVGDGPKVLVRVVHRPRQREFALRHLRAAIGTLEQFSQMFVPYPWSIMTVIDPPLEAAEASGMEYPTLVTTAGDHALARDGLRWPEFVTIHEVGHNWFQGMLASNEYEEAWLDEGISEWADGVAMVRLYGEKRSALDWMGWSADIFHWRRAMGSHIGDLPAPIATAPYAFPDQEAYGETTYLKTMLALRTLENSAARRGLLYVRRVSGATNLPTPCGPSPKRGHSSTRLAVISSPVSSNTWAAISIGFGDQRSTSPEPRTSQCAVRGAIASMRPAAFSAKAPAVVIPFFSSPTMQALAA